MWPRAEQRILLFTLEVELVQEKPENPFMVFNERHGSYREQVVAKDINFIKLFCRCLFLRYFVGGLQPYILCTVGSLDYWSLFLNMFGVS
ncbi:uncharacterized protein LOC132636389 isoform X2 [Lycium barbarum]|uniref:uncharacterized protein LOC132636389 isoform X2 n=1 Tax=Lycium barbarum TaxID=112863 RepID=UPI00293EF999|nr:uncharacterized protein LOC132636389 isoform X2 [Lycium barbarum]